MQTNNDLQRKVRQQARRMKQAEKDSPTLLAQTRVLGTLGLVLVLPVILGAYLGQWLDEKLGGDSAFWTVSLILTGVVIGIVNVYLLIRESS